jgi:hypothetical protein
MRSVLLISSIKRRVIKKPDKTKKTSTPINPPDRRVRPEWDKITNNTAIALSPWRSVRKLKSLIFIEHIL